MVSTQLTKIFVKYAVVESHDLTPPTTGRLRQPRKMNLLKVSLSLTAWLQNVSKRSPEFFRYQVQMCKVSSHLLAIRPWSRPSWQTWPSQTPGQTWWTLVGSGSLEEHYLFNTAFQYGGCITKVARGHISQHRNVRACVCVACLCHLLFINEWCWMHMSWPFLPFRGVCEHLLGLLLY